MLDLGACCTGYAVGCEYEMRVNDHLRCHHALDGWPCQLLMRMSQRLACGSHAHVPVGVTP
ncbi:MAG TPA: hypothetical protein DEF43_02050 [Chloroflexus aurantiacus]|nr:MAG: hypothetical protein D6716_17220 [Chloroflexota bacterium]HBW65950.1 hypothetical protein [Chloroflexus aurantiacus]